MEYIANLENVDMDIVIYILKTTVIAFFTFYLSLKIIDKRYKTKKTIIPISILIMILSIFCGIIKYFTNSINSITFLVIVISLVFSKITKKEIGFSIIINIISLSINYILFMLATGICFIPTIAFNITNVIYNLIIITIVYMVEITIFNKIKKFKHGFEFLNNKLSNQYINLLVFIIGSEVIFTFVILSNYNRKSTRQVFSGFIVFSIIMIITILQSLQLYYKQKMLVKDLEETKEELENKKKEVEALEKENLEFSKISHSIAHKQKSLEHKLNELSMKSEIADELDIKDRIDDLSKNLMKETIVVLDKTGITEIDDMLSYMQSECVKNKIDFQLQLNGNIYTMINHHIDKEELEILLADHIKNAIIAIGYGDNVNKSILVRLGKLDGSYGLYVYDSGIEFEIETLLNLGKKPSTTHKDSGGTGMGFMNTFDTLRKHNASFIIEEYGKPVKDNFTKALKFKFDGKNEFKICSYREEEIKNKDKENSLIVEKLSL